MDLSTLPTRRPVEFVVVTLVLLRDDRDRSLRLWYGEAEPTDEQPTKAWDPLKNYSRRCDHWQVWFWRRVLSLSDLYNFVEHIQTHNLIKIDSNAIPVQLPERSPVLFPVGHHEAPLCPVAEQSAWLWELWDEKKEVRKLSSEEWARWVNAAVDDALGIDLNYWSDRVGNLLMFFPSGVVTQWYYDPVEQAAVIRTNLSVSELVDYEIEIEAWESDEVVTCQRTRPEGPLAAFNKVPSPSRATLRVYKRGSLLHYDIVASMIKIIQQWRICFVWRADGAYAVEIVDYH